MKLINKSINNFSHTIDGRVYFLAVGSTLDVPEEVASLWLKMGGVEKVIDEAEIKKLQEKIAKLEAEKEAEKEAKPKTSKTKTRTKKETK